MRRWRDRKSREPSVLVSGAEPGWPTAEAPWPRRPARFPRLNSEHLPRDRASTRSRLAAVL